MMTRCHQMTGQQRRSGHPEKQWYLMQERRDSRLISPKSCPTDWVHLRVRSGGLQHSGQMLFI